MKKMRQPQAMKSSGVISDLTKITEPKPSSSPIGMAKPTQAPQKARYFERAACSTTQVEAVPNSAPKLMPWQQPEHDQQDRRGDADAVVGRRQPDRSVLTPISTSA